MGKRKNVVANMAPEMELWRFQQTSDTQQGEGEREERDFRADPQNII